MCKNLDVKEGKGLIFEGNSFSGDYDTVLVGLKVEVVPATDQKLHHQ